MESNVINDQKLRGFYRGQVIQHLGSGKCKIYIPGVFPEECLDNPECIPDAEQAAPLFGGVNNGNGCFSYPNIGATVWCFFENGDQNFPVYFASTLGGETAVDNSTEGFQRVRDNVCRNRDDKSNDTTLNGKDSQKHMIKCGDSRMTISESGNVHIICGSDKEQESEIIMDVRGNIWIKSKNIIQLQAQNIQIGANDTLELKATNINMSASQEIGILSKKVTNVAKNAIYNKSVSITEDASQGSFTAMGKTHRPFFLY